MVDINLSVFTKNSFSSWFDYKTNREIIQEIKGFDPESPPQLDENGNEYDPPITADEIYDDAFNALLEPRNRDDLQITEGGGVSASGLWRKEGRNGQYIELENLNEWEYTNAEGKRYRWFLVEEHPVIYRKSFPASLVELNDHIQEKLVTTPDIESDDWSDYDRAAFEFFTDVNSSKQRCLKWKTVLGFKRNELVKGDDGYAKIRQPSEDDSYSEYESKVVEFKLFFYSLYNRRRTERKVGAKEINIVAPKKDSTGRPYLFKEEGRHFAAIHQENPKSHAGASLDVKYTEFLNKWESGTPQMLAVISTVIPPVQKPDFETFLNEKAASILHHETGLEVLHGSAIPISMDQCNPLQWCPHYMRDERYRVTGSTEDLSKFQVDVYNLSDTTGFNPGDIVMLSRIDGVWVPMLFAQGTAEAVKGSLVEWDFTYLMTNADYFFRTVENQDLDFPGNETFGYEDFEQAIHIAYYSGGDLTVGSQLQSNKLNLETYSKVGDVRYADVTNNFFQVTSWDFMGPDIGGLRDNNALACTQFSYYSDNESVNGSNAGRDTLNTSGPFFGCVFPDGYNEEQKVSDLEDTERDFSVNGVFSKDPDGNVHQYFRNIDSSVNVFNNRNSNILESSKGGMFAHANINQLPADIGVNSSPNGINGRPISNSRMLPFGLDGLQSKFREYFKNHEDGDASGLPKRYSWFYKHPEENFTPASRYESAFNIKPLNIKRIQFRPLKTETYACFELQNKFDVDIRSEERGEFARRMWNSQGDDQNPIAVAAKARNSLFTPNGLIDENLGLIYEDSVTYRRPRSDNNPDLLWARDWISTSPDNQGNAFGIIGAACSVTFSSKIQFITDNFIGMQPWFLSNFLYNSWGRGDYNGRHTTQLSVRAFHAWPKEQTIYDSRFFSVHHFNEGVERQDPLSADEAEKVRVSGAILDVDLLEVLSPPVGSKISSDTDIFESGVSTIRRGKLLPFKYQYKTLGVGPYVQIIPDDIPPEKISDPLGLTAQDTNILIKSSGENYSESDRFILSGGNGDGALLKPVLGGDNNGVVGFEIVHSGHSYVKENFLVGDTVLNSSTESDIIIRESGENVAGQGLTAIVVGGTVVNSEVLTDERPKEIFFRKLSPDPPTDGGLNQIADSDYEITVGFGDDIPESYKSSNGKYDLFFYFHNDISHTWDWDRGTLPPAYEQKLGLQVNLDPDT